MGHSILHEHEGIERPICNRHCELHHTDRKKRRPRAQSLIIRRATQLAVWCEMAEAEAAGGNPLNISEYATATNTLRRLLLDLGLERRIRDITPSIDRYLAKS